MRTRNNVMDLLADSRPAYFDDPGDLARRRGDLERATSTPVPLAFSDAPAVRLRRSRPMVIGIAAAATVAAVTGGSAALFAQKDAEGSPAGAPAAAATAANPTGKFLVDSSETHYLSPIRLNGKVFQLDEVATTQTWSPRSTDGRRITAETQHYDLSDAESLQAWKSAGSPAKVKIGVIGKGAKSIEFDRSVPLNTPFPTETTTTNAIVEFAECGDMDKCAQFPVDAAGVTQRFNSLVQAKYEWNLRSQKELEKDGDPENGDKPVAHVPASTIRTAATFDVARELLDAPISTTARLTIVHLLEAAPGIKNLGPVEDQKGRAGTGYTDNSTTSGGTELRLVVEPKSGQLLAEEERRLSTTDGLHSWLKPTDIVRSTVHLDKKWSDAAAPKPKIRHYPDGTSDLNWPPR